MELADRYRKLEVRANADSPTDARLARTFGATGIGLCRTEHMFLKENGSRWWEMILADNERPSPGAGPSVAHSARGL